VTALVLTGIILAVLAGQMVLHRQWHPWLWLRTVGITLLVCLALSGWHYWRVWSAFGTPFVGTYDTSSGFRWWQDPGHGPMAPFWRFGRALEDPFFSGFSGYADGLYSTLWGDGLFSGESSLEKRPPWRWDLMAAGYALALLPAGAMMLGTLAALYRL